MNRHQNTAVGTFATNFRINLCVCRVLTFGVWAFSCVGISFIQEIDQTTTNSNFEPFIIRVIWLLPRKGLSMYKRLINLCDYIKRIIYTWNVSINSIFMAYSYHRNSLSPPMLIFMIISKDIITTIAFLPTMHASVLYCCFVLNKIYNYEKMKSYQYYDDEDA